MPRPLSATRTPPSARIVTSIRSATPASASSTELSTSSCTRWCSPRSPVEPMYMPGRLRTASSPSRTVIAWASYAAAPAWPFRSAWERSEAACMPAVVTVLPLGTANHALARHGARAVGSLDGKWVAGRPKKPLRARGSRHRRRRDASQDIESPMRSQGEKAPRRPPRHRRARQPIPPARTAGKPWRGASEGSPGSLARGATEAFSSGTLRGREPAPLRRRPSPYGHPRKPSTPSGPRPSRCPAIR